MFEVQGTEFWKPQAALGFGSSHTDSEEQCLEKCGCPLCLSTVLSACPWRPLGVTKGPRKPTVAFLLRLIGMIGMRDSHPLRKALSLSLAYSWLTPAAFAAVCDGAPMHMDRRAEHRESRKKLFVAAWL